MPATALLCLLPLLALSAASPVPASPALPIAGNVVLETSYGFPSLTALYSIYHPAVSFSLPLQRTEDNAAELLAGQSDFSLIAGPLSAAQAAAYPNLTVLPVLGTAIVPVYRLDALCSRNGSSGGGGGGSVGCDTPLTFSGRTLAGIFVGAITAWNDPLIAADNPDVPLPATNISVAYQADSRILNLVFTTALNKYDPSIAAVLPAAPNPAWPTARYAASLPGYGLLGVASNVVDNDGSIGFCPQPSALTVGATVGWMYTALGGQIDADASSVSFAMTELLTAGNLTSFPDVTLCRSSFCWPIVIVSYLLMDNVNSPRGCAVRNAVVDFWLWYLAQYDASTAPMLAHWGLAPTPKLIANEEALGTQLLTSVLCDGAQAGTPTANTALSVYGPSRLMFLFHSTDEFFNSANDDHRFDYVASDSLTALTTGRDTLALAALYKDDIVAGGGSSALDTSQWYLLPTFLTSIVFVYNTDLSRTVNAGNVSLAIDFKALALIFSGNISDWHHPYLLELNPILATLLDTNPAPLTLALACTSLATLSSSPLLAYLTYYLQAYATADTVSAPYIAALFADQLQLFDSCVSTGVGGVVYSTSEATIGSQVANLPGAVGYQMDENAEDVGEFALLFPALVDGQIVRTARRSTSEGLLACATLDTFDPSTLNLNVAAGYMDSNCYPLAQVLFMQVPHDYPIHASSTAYITLSALSSLANSSHVDGFFNSSMFVRATQLPFLQSAVIAALDSVTAGGAGNTLLVTLPRVWVLSRAVQYSGFVIAVLGGLTTLVTLCAFVWYSKDSRLRASSPLIMSISLCGVLCMYAAVVCLVLAPSGLTCGALGWFCQIGFTLTFAPLLAKAYRIYRIFGRKRLRVIRITDRRLLLFIASMLALDAVLLTSASIISGGPYMQPVSITATMSSDLRQHVYSECATAPGAGTVVFALQAIVKCGMLVGGVLLAFATRGVSDEFNESASIALAVYNMVVVLLLIIPINVVVNALGDTFVILLLFLVAWIATFTLGVLFVTKLVAFLASTRSSTAVTHRRSRSYAGQQFSFLSIDHIPSSAALLPYIAALNKHSTDCKQLLARLQLKETLTPPKPAAAAPHTVALPPPLPGQLRLSGSRQRDCASPLRLEAVRLAVAPDEVTVATAGAGMEVAGCVDVVGRRREVEGVAEAAGCERLARGVEIAVVGDASAASALVGRRQARTEGAAGELTLE